MGDGFEDKPKLERIDKKYIAREIQAIVNVEKGLLFTVKNLLIKPGATVRDYLFYDRKKYMKPLLFLIFSSIVFSLLISALDVNVTFFNIDTISILKGKIRSREIGAWTQRNIGYSQLIMGIFVALWLALFYRKSKFNFYEIVVLLSYVFGEGLLILGAFFVMDFPFKGYFFLKIGFMFYFLYIPWGIGQFFGERKWKNYLIALLVYLLGSLSYISVLVLIAYLLTFI